MIPNFGLGAIFVSTLFLVVQVLAVVGLGWILYKLWKEMW